MGTRVKKARRKKPKVQRKGLESLGLESIEFHLGTVNPVIYGRKGGRYYVIRWNTMENRVIRETSFEPQETFSLNPKKTVRYIRTLAWKIAAFTHQKATRDLDEKLEIRRKSRSRYH